MSAPPAPRVAWLPSFAAGAIGVQVGAAMVATRFVIAETEPASLALLRYAIGLVCLVPPLVLAKPVPIARRDLLPISLLGVAQFGLLIALLNWGLRFVPAGRGALIFATFPLLTMLLATAAGHERLDWAKGLGVAASVGGVGVVLGERVLAPGSLAEEWLGALAILASALLGAACSVFYRPYLRRYPTLNVSALAMLAAVVFLAGLAAAEGFFSGWPRFSAGGWAAVVFIGVSSGVGYYVWLWALRHAPATRVAVFLSLSPVTAVVLGALLLGELVSPFAVLGLAAVVVGLWLAHRPSELPPPG